MELTRLAWTPVNFSRHKKHSWLTKLRCSAWGSVASSISFAGPREWWMMGMDVAVQRCLCCECWEYKSYGSWSEPRLEVQDVSVAVKIVHFYAFLVIVAVLLQDDILHAKLRLDITAMNTALACMPSWELAREVLTDMSVLDEIIQRQTDCAWPLWNSRVCRRCISLGQRCWNETATLKFQPYLSRFNSELSTSAPLHRGCFAECDLHQNPAALNEWTTHRLMKWLDMFVRREKTEGAEACWRMPIWGSEAGVWKISNPPSYSTCDFGMFITVVCMWMFSFPFLSSLNRVCSQVTTCLWILSELLPFESMTKDVQMMSCEQQSPRYISLQSIQASRIKLLLLISTVLLSAQRQLLHIPLVCKEA